MKWIFGGMVFLALLFGILNGRMAEVTTGALSGAVDAVTLTLTLAGAICLWSGLMNVAKKSGLTQKISRLFSPVLSRLFRKMDPNDPAMESVSMNVTANMLGLGNAATPLGIQAMQQMQRKNPNPKVATHNMILFVVINSASLQIIPTTVATLRMTEGSQNPMAILLPMLLTSLCSLVSVIVATKLFAKAWRDETV